MMKMVSSFLSLPVGTWNGKLGTTEPGLAQLCASPTSSTLANLCTAPPAGSAETFSLSLLHCGAGDLETKSKSVCYCR